MFFIALRNATFALGILRPQISKRFFWCYLSSQLTELIDMSHIEKMKISMGTRTVPGITPGSLWASGVSGLVARCGIGPSTVQNSLGRKWDIKSKQSCSSEGFAWDLALYGG